jgi:hypothetical protein
MSAPAPGSSRRRTDTRNSLRSDTLNNLPPDTRSSRRLAARPARLGTRSDRSLQSSSKPDGVVVLSLANTAVRPARTTQHQLGKRRSSRRTEPKS